MNNIKWCVYYILNFYATDVKNMDLKSISNIVRMNDIDLCQKILYYQSIIDDIMQSDIIDGEKLFSDETEITNDFIEQFI